MRISNTKLLLCLLLLAVLGGCAVQPSGFSGNQHDPRDPWESYNRSVFAFNTGIDNVFLKPISSGYATAVPSFIRHRITSFFANVGDIPNAANNALQGNFKRSVSDLIRFLINSTIGLLGLVDVASKIDGLEKSNEDFGQTLAVWGVGSGPYFVIPFLGSSTVRDFPSRAVDGFMNPLVYLEDDGLRNGLLALDTVNTRAEFINIESTVQSLSPDYYVAVRSFYLARRKHLINNNQEAVDGSDDIYQEILD